MKRKTLAKFKIRDSFILYIQNYTFWMLITFYPTSIFLLLIIFASSFINNLSSSFFAQVEVHRTANKFQSHIQVIGNV